jgi:hypothetical protein
VQSELVEKELKVGLGLSVTRKDDRTTIARGEINVDHLHRAELLKYGTRSYAGCQVSQASAQRDRKTVGHKGDKDVGFDAMGKLMKNRANT